ncbi:two-component regulator propeller domain-containing protein [Tunturiibacter lichenicola]|uniref:two-component regulator propeller domain-containing protein n=1 Tax=Tunturiibacter lichenicola TaxID=2051959 RepID=UPI003D9BDAAA
MTVLRTMWGKAVVVRIRARRVFVLGTVLAYLSLVAFPRALALDPDRRISQYAHTAWRVRDGVFAGAPTSITQTTDGYVWIGTLGGLLRFDGVRFVRWTPPTGEHLPTTVISLLGAADGSLWIGTAAGLAQWKNGNLLNFPETAGRVNSIYEDREGTIWMVRSRTRAGAVCKVTLSVAKCYAPEDGVPPYAGTLTGDNSGYLWIGTSTALVRWKPGSSTSYELPGLKSNAALAGITALAAAPDGSVWAGILNSGHGLGLQHWVNGTLRTLITTALDGSTLKVIALGLDRHNALWIGTERNGIYRVHDGKVERFRSADGLSSETAESFFEDREGNLWVTTPEGVDCFRDIPVVNFSVHEGLTGDMVDSILAARNGTIWIGNHSGLDYLRGDVVSSIGPKNGLPGSRVTSLLEDHAGRLWVGLDNGLFVYERGRFRPIRRRDGGTIGVVLRMIEDVDSCIWAVVVRTGPGNPGGLVQIQDGRFATEIADERLGIPTSLAGDPEGGLWLGLLKGGLARYRNGQLQIFPLENTNAQVLQVLANSDGSVLAATTDGLVERRGEIQYTLDHHNGLPCDRTYALVTDKYSNLWLYTECGLILIKSDDLQQWRRHHDLKVRFDLFDAYDGAQPYLADFKPRATRSNDGRLWFANGTVAQMIDPDRLFRNSIPPPVHIEAVIADRKSYPSQDGLRLPALTRDLEIDYTALSFVVPQKVQFRYKLDGHDREWQEPQTRRQAFYSNLRPGNYRFHVMASNNSGVWNEAGAELDFNIGPAYYQTTWFRLLCVAAFLAFLLGLHQLRVQQLRREERNFREAFETIPAMAWIGGPDDVIQFLNRRWVEYTGLSQLENPTEIRKNAIHADDLDRIERRLAASIASGEPVEEELRFRRTDGEYRWFLSRLVPLRDKRGKVVRWYGAATDIQDRKRAEELQADLAHTNRVTLLGELVASISHDLAQPITATTNNAKASLNWLQRDPPDLTQVRKGTERIIEAGTFASEIINRLRSLYQKSPLKRELVAINEVIGEMAKMLRGEANGNGVSIRTDLAADLPKITADRVQLQQVLMNLMLNGNEAMKDTGGVLTVKSQLGEDGQIQISIHDTGPGLPVGKADQIFDAFFTTKPQGSGMGLAISKSIVESHGGRIWANSGRGATFHFTLPTAPAETNPPVDAA